MTTPLSTIHQLAFREGCPEDWSRAELNFEISDRICSALGTREVTDDIRAIALAEEERQRELMSVWETERYRRADDAAYRERMGAIADRISEAIGSYVFIHRQHQLESAILQALRPLDERLRAIEAQLGRVSAFTRPIG